MDTRNFDKAFIAFAEKYYSPLARVAIFIIFFYFGLLKLLGLSPADQLAQALVESTVGGQYFDILFILLAIFECIIGILFLIPKYTRIAVFLLFLHLPLVTSPLLLAPDEVWSSVLVPNLEGQYIIKNVALVVLALGLVSRAEPLKK